MFAGPDLGYVGPARLFRQLALGVQRGLALAALEPPEELLSSAFGFCCLDFCSLSLPALALLALTALARLAILALTSTFGSPQVTPLDFGERSLLRLNSNAGCIALERLSCLQQGRNIRALAGAAAPLRAHSEWAGSWTGVMVAADWPMHPVQIPWPAGIFETARAQIAQVLIEGFPLLVANVYGYSRSHPQAAAATDALLEPITKELVFGRVGPRVICGDLNAEEDGLLQTRLWRQQQAPQQAKAWRSSRWFLSRSLPQ